MGRQQQSLLVEQKSIHVSLRAGRRRSEQFGFCRVLLLMQRPNNRFQPTGVPPDLAGQVQDASG
jgi:hypothetical protein